MTWKRKNTDLTCPGNVSGNSITQASTTSTGASKSPLARSTKINRIIITGRLTFIFTLAAVAATFGYLSYYLLAQCEDLLAETQFDSVASRATAAAVEILERKRLGTVSLASMICSANHDSEKWPLVSLDYYEQVADDLIETSKGCYMVFAPLVTPEELPSFERHAYDYYEKDRKPEPFPNNTAISSFGKGVFGIDPSLNSTDNRYHESDGETTWGSPNKIFAPMLHHVTGASKSLLFNLHSDKIMGTMIDDMMGCALGKARTGGKIEECTALSPIKPNATSWVQKVDSGPGSTMIQPAYAGDDPSKIRGVVVTSLVWGEVMKNTYTKCVDGVQAVLKAGDQSYTFNIVSGEAKLMGMGDLHDTKFDDLVHEVDLTPISLFGPASEQYTLSVYPTQEFYDMFTTDNPKTAAIGAVVIILFTAGMFLLYDTVMRREFYAKRDLLEAKRKFVRFVSHEVRTPLNSVCMGLAVLKEELTSRLSNLNSDTERAQDLVLLTDEISYNVYSAVDVLNDFLNYDKVETGKLTLELSIIGLFKLVDDTVSEFKASASKKKINLTVETPFKNKMVGENDCFTVGDVMRLTQVLRNLVSNAIKFTPKKGSIAVRVVWVPAGLKQKASYRQKTFKLKNGDDLKVIQDGSLLIKIADTGAGMTKDQLSSVFSQGTQFNVNTLQAGNGSGLGTWIARGIVREHGGTLLADSDGLEEGTTFTISLPSYDINHSPEPSSTFHIASNFDDEDEAEDEGEELGVLKVLVVDDARMNLKLLMRLCSKHGHTVDGAEDGVIAVDKASSAMRRGDDFDVILMDYQMPNMDGPTAARKLRDMGCNAFIVGVTGNVMAEDVRYFKECGANAVLPKPVKFATLESLWIEYGVKGDTTTRQEDPIVEFEPTAQSELENKVSAGTAERPQFTRRSSLSSIVSRRSSAGSRVDMSGGVVCFEVGEHKSHQSNERSVSDDWASRRTASSSSNERGLQGSRQSSCGSIIDV